MLSGLRRALPASSTALEMRSHQVPFPGQESLGRPDRAKTKALKHPSISSAAHRGSLDPSKTPRRNSAPAEKNPSSPFASRPSTLRAPDPRIAGHEHPTFWLVCSRSVLASPSRESAPKQPTLAVSIPGAEQEVDRLRRPPADKMVMWEKAVKPGVAYRHRRRNQSRRR